MLWGGRQGQSIKEIRLDSKTIAPNPYDYINEVRNPELFAGRREELAQLEEEVANLADDQGIPPMIAIVGERRIGKTSISLRLQEICERHQVPALRVSLTDVTAADAWEFWQEVFHELRAFIRSQVNPTTSLGIGVTEGSTLIGLNETQPEFFSAYNRRTAVAPPNPLVYECLKSLVAEITEASYPGVLLIIDEAHLVVPNRGITQQLRVAVHETGRCGVVFVGEPVLAQLFSDHGQPLFAQGKVISLKNFAAQEDVAECALLPLAEDDQRLVSPMTIDYLVKLSQGKPNQIRLICNSIYNRYQKRQQDDLNITIEALDDILDNISNTYTDYDVTQKVQTIRTLNSVDLETLYNMTRYPNWATADIVELDESFRAEGKSMAASSRREAMLQEKREKFIELGLMVKGTQNFILAGDEFLSLYLRFWYEISKYGELSRSLVLGKGPPTPFGEKTEKLIRFIAWELGRPPSFVINTFDARDHEYGDRGQTVRARFTALEALMQGNPPQLGENPDVVGEWFKTCELVRDTGSYHVLCLWVRNRENPRETVATEIYFDSVEDPLLLPVSTLDSLRQRADSSRISIEGSEYFTADIPSLTSLLEMIGAPNLNEWISQFDPVLRWRFASVQHLVARGDEQAAEPDDADAKEPGEWIKLYGEGKFADAEENLITSLRDENDRQARARLCNDLGYIRYELQKKDEAKRDLQQALDLHFHHLTVTLANLGVACLDDEDYKGAISYFQDAIFLTVAPEDVDAAYLRLRLPTGHIARKGDWEQNPANVLEASYINLSFALLQSGNVQDATDVLQEGLDLIPSSVRLKHAFARLQVSQNRVDLADPFYSEIAQQPISDTALANEVKRILRSRPRQRSRRHRNK